MNGVVMLVNEFPPLPVGGAERQAERLSAYLAGRSWPVWVITRRAGGLPSSEVRTGFTILRLPAVGPGKIKTVVFVLAILVQLWKMRSKYGVLHAHLAVGPAFAAGLAARLLGKRVIVKFGNSGEYGEVRTSQNSLRGKLRLAALRRWADIIVVLDEVMQEEAIAAGFDSVRIRRIANGINPAAFSSPESQSARALRLHSSARVNVLFVGRLSPQKNIPFLLQIFAQSLRECPGLHMVIVGDGPEKGQSEQLAVSLGIAKHVTFAGSQQDIRPYLAAADIFVLPSLSEGISNALLEAMSAGLACIATPVGGSVEVLDQGRCGLLLPVGDVPAWTNALASLGNSPRLRQELGAAALERVSGEYSFDVIGSRYEALYAELFSSLHLGKSRFADVKP